MSEDDVNYITNCIILPNNLSLITRWFASNYRVVWC